MKSDSPTLLSDDDDIWVDVAREREEALAQSVAYAKLRELEASAQEKSFWAGSTRQIFVFELFIFAFGMFVSMCFVSDPDSHLTTHHPFITWLVCSVSLVVFVNLLLALLVAAGWLMNWAYKDQ